MSTVERMPGRASPSWCPRCRCEAGPDCPDRARSPRQVRRQLSDELRRETHEALHERQDRER